MTMDVPARPAPARGRAALQRSIAWYLRQLSRVLNVLSDEELERLVPLLTERHFKPRQVLFSEGDPVERVYLIVKGRVKGYQVAENGKEIILDVVGKGGVVGDMAVGAAGVSCRGRTTPSKPATASTSAVPDPMIPVPTTPTVRTGTAGAGSVRVAGSVLGADMAGDVRPGTHLRA